MEWKRMDAYQTLVARLQEKYRARDGAVSALLDEGVPGKLLARARKMRRRLADNLCMPGPAVATDAKVTARLQQDGYAIENVIITDDTGYAIPVNLYLPDAEPGPHPAVVVSMGALAPGQAVAGKPDILRKPCPLRHHRRYIRPHLSGRALSLQPAGI